MKKLISIAIITLGLTAVTFAQKTVIEDSNPEKNLITNTKNVKNKKAKHKVAKKLTTTNQVQEKEVSAEQKYKLSRTRMMRDPINRSLYNEKIRRLNGYRYNNRPYTF